MSISLNVQKQKTPHFGKKYRNTGFMNTKIVCMLAVNQPFEIFYMKTIPCGPSCLLFGFFGNESVPPVTASSSSSFKIAPASSIFFFASSRVLHYATSSLSFPVNSIMFLLRTSGDAFRCQMD